MKTKTNYNPDVLSCLANLSSDEVFTPPDLANDILDLLPKEIWSDKNATFLDPVSKSGVFLREIAKRLLEGLEDEIPDDKERIEHVYTKQVFGIAITELTALLSRRSLYCSKKANGKYSIVETFNDSSGNVFFDNIPHTWKNGRCSFCGARQLEYEREKGLETHAYQFIHNKLPNKIKNMKFDVIIGNPPYQLHTGGSSAQAIPLYNKFIGQAKELEPRYLVMIIPARWYSGGMGLDDFRRTMLNDRRIRILHDFIDASDCFSGVEIKGGVCYFLWDRDNYGDCKVVTYRNSKVSKSVRSLLEKENDIFIRFNEAIPILNKVRGLKEKLYLDIVSSQRPFGLPTNYNIRQKEGGYKVYANRKIGFVSEKEALLRNLDFAKKWKIFTPKAIGSGNMGLDYIKPIIGEPNSICTETYIMHGPFNTEEECKNAISYIKTRFFHFLVGLKKVTQDSLRNVFEFVPLQDFSEPWTDEKLYKKYKLTQEEIDFIESMVRPMD